MLQMLCESKTLQYLMDETYRKNRKAKKVNAIKSGQNKNMC